MKEHTVPKNAAQPATSPISLIQNRFDRAEIVLRPMR